MNRHLTPLRALALLLALLAAAACAKREYEVVDVFELPSSARCPWVGKEEAAVVESFGNPATRDADGQGGAILTYRRVKSTVSVGSGHYDGPVVPDSGTATPAPVGGTHPLPSTELVYEDLAEFRVDPEGTVYRCWVDPDYERKKAKDPSHFDAGTVPRP